MTLARRRTTDIAEPRAPRVLVVDDHTQARQSMAEILRSCGHQVETSAGAAEALHKVDRGTFDVILTDLRMPGMSGVDFIRALEERRCEAQIVMVTAHASVDTAVEAMRHGAFDYIEKPLRADALEELVTRALSQSSLADRKTAVPPGDGERGQVVMIGSSPAMRTLRQRIAQTAATNETVLITGESGTGKELVARSIHLASERSRQALVSLNCPVLSAQLLESELFGHERGAFTSADAPRVGRFELADGGTILLDEITEIELPLQAKLLRVLQEKTFERIGSSHSIAVDIRVLATTNRELNVEVAEGRFREDLYFRLAVLPVHVPPLRDRIEDVAELIDHFLTQSAHRLNREPSRLDRSAEELLVNYDWPGNVRELENIVTRASVLCTGEVITADQVRPWLIGNHGLSADGQTVLSAETDLPVGLSLEEMERKLILATLDHLGGHRQKTAQALGIGVRTLANKLRGYGLPPRAKALAKAA
jgi:DNA-binding NtrC family response regulator